MIEFEEYKSKLNDLKPKLEELRAAFVPQSLLDELVQGIFGDLFAFVHRLCLLCRKHYHTPDGIAIPISNKISMVT